jgi:hypothetical protein
MDLNPEQRRLAILLAILAVVAVWALINSLGSGGVAANRVTAEKLEWKSHNLPELYDVNFGEVDVRDPEDVRNPFVFGPRPTPTPNLTPPPTPPPRPTRRPPKPRPTPTPTPPGWRPPPSFTMEYIGMLGPASKRVAVFRRQSQYGAEIEVAPVDGVLEEQFIVREIGLESVVIGFVGFPDKERTRVPLAPQ